MARFWARTGAECSTGSRSAPIGRRVAVVPPEALERRPMVAGRRFSSPRRGRADAQVESHREPRHRTPVREHTAVAQAMCRHAQVRALPMIDRLLGYADLPLLPQAHLHTT